MRRTVITIGIGLGTILFAGALLAARFDLVSLKPLAPLVTPDTQHSAVAARASAPTRIVASAVAAPIAQRPAEDAPKAPSSTFDVVRIDPDGASVFAGRAPANADVTVLANDKPVAAAKADENGEWATVIERRFAAGQYQLSLTAKPDGTGAQVSGQSVNITIASNAQPATAEAKAVASPPAEAQAPAPIVFPYDQAGIAPIGRKQAAELSAFLRQRRLAAVTLSGHADSRGSDEYNMQLSRQRLESVARFLRASGYAGKLVLVPKGKSEPNPSVDRAKLSPEEAFQLDRRVELLRSDR